MFAAMNNNNEQAALLVMDVQPGIIDRVRNREEYLAKINAAVDAAHERRMPVIFVVVGFREGAPEAVGRMKQMAPMLTNPQPLVAPTGDDLVVTKRRVSAFTGSDLEVILRAQNIRHLVLTGIATSGVVLSTLREAADKDFTLTVLSDLCADTDPEVHAVLTGKVFPRQAAVMTSEEWLRG
jgi:nicotinamidase-related amidase